MSVKVTSLVWESDVAPANVRITLLALADNANDEGMCWPGTEHLCGKTGVGRSTTFRILDRLEAEGLLVRHQRRRADGSLRSTLYQINLEELAKRARTVAAEARVELAEVLDISGRLDGATALKLSSNEPPW